MKKGFFSDRLPTPEEHPKTGWPKFEAITWPEVAGVCLLMAATVVVGVWPKVLLDQIEPAVKALLAGGMQ